MRGLIRAYDGLLNTLCLACGIIILFAVFAVTMDVIWRYMFSSSIPWVFEITEYGLLYIPCLGMAWLVRERGHVAIDTFVLYLPSRIQKILAVLIGIVCAVICAIIAYYSFVLVVKRFLSGATYENILTIPEYWVLWVIPFGFALSSIEFTRSFLWPNSYSIKADEVAS